MADPFASAKTARLPQASLAYVERGDGPPVVLVHGSASDLRTWTHQVDALSARFRVIAYSRRYARPNEDIPRDGADPIDAHVDDLAEMLRVTGAAPAHLVGHSWGGLIVLLLTLRRPDLVRSMTLIEAPALTLFVDVPPKPLQLLSLLLRAPSTALAIMRFGAGAIGPAESAFRRGDDAKAVELIGRGILGPAYFERLSKDRFAQVWENRAADRAQILGHEFPKLDAAEIGRLALPTLLIGGSDSPDIFGKINEALATLIPNAELHRLSGASHLVHEDAPEAANALLLDFLR